MKNEWDIKIFTSNLEKYMRINSKTQTDIAKALKVSTPTVHDWVKGNKMPKMSNVQKLADYFHVNLSDLVEKREEVEKNSDVLVNITIRLGNDIDFREIVKRNYSDDDYFELNKMLSKMDSEQIKSVKVMLSTFFK